MPFKCLINAAALFPLAFNLAPPSVWDLSAINSGQPTFIRFCSALFPMQFSAPSLVKYIADHLKRCSSLKEVESWYSLMLKNNTAQDCFLVNQYITACSNVRTVDSAVFAFSQIEDPNVFVYNALIGAFINGFRPFEGLWCYVSMLRNGILPSSYTFPPVIKSCRVLSVVRFGECVHSQILKNGLGFHLHIQTVLVDFYSSLGRVVEPRKVFDEMSERDDFACSTMISAHARAGDLDSARSVFDNMPVKSTALWNAMVQGYVDAGKVESAEQLFYTMGQKDVISWTTMISCYCKHDRYREALETFNEMKRTETRPDEMTMATVISACAHLGALEQGKEMHLYVMQNMPNSDVYIGSSLIDMYAKCGMLERALVVFFKLHDKNIYCWSSVIDGLAHHGYAEEALVMFDKMKKEKFEPNNVIFVSILAACSHAGLVGEGKRIFLEMTSKYSILPGIEHYGCMVDLLCRVGLLEEALSLIKGMRLEPNAVIWGALLSGCKHHKNLEIAQIAVEKLLILEPNNSGYYYLLINLYAEENRWSEVSGIRVIMKESGVDKIWPGSSWIEMENKMHQFAACDNCHPASKEIYLVLDGLDSHLKLSGFDFCTLTGLG